MRTHVRLIIGSTSAFEASASSSESCWVMVPKMKVIVVCVGEMQSSPKNGNLHCGFVDCSFACAENATARFQIRQSVVCRSHNKSKTLPIAELTECEADLLSCSLPPRSAKKSLFMTPSHLSTTPIIAVCSPFRYLCSAEAFRI